MTSGERFMSKVDQQGPPSTHRPELGDCWLWMGARDNKGYGKIKRAGRWIKAHRFAYELLVGTIPDGLQLDHLCRVRHCVNPAHLEPVTNRENCRRGEPAQRTHCPKGHPYDAANTMVVRGKRRCRQCERTAKLIRYWTVPGVREAHIEKERALRLRAREARVSC